MRLIIGALLLFILGFSCNITSPQQRKNGQPKASTAKKVAAKKTKRTPIHITEESKLLEAFYRYEGQAGGKATVGILYLGESEVYGTYYYERIGIPINLSGKRLKNDSVYLEEYSLGYEASGTLAGRIQKNGDISGFWVSEDGLRKTSFIFHQTKIPGLTPQLKNYYHKKCEAAFEPKNRDGEGIDTSCIQLQASILTLNTKVPSVAQKINSKLSSRLDAIIKSEIWIGDKSVSTFTSLWNAVKQSQIITDFSTYELSINAYVSYMDEHIICLGISYWQNASGYAHPWDSSEEFVFDLKTGNLVTLSSIMKPNFKTSLINIGRKAMQKVFSHPSLESKDFIVSENFTVNPFGLIFHYRRGEIGSSYADIPFEFFIPFDDIKHLLNSGTILSNYLKF